MWQQRGFLQHQRCRGMQILERGFVTEGGEGGARLRVAEFRFVAERKQSLVQPAASPRRATASTSSGVI